MPGLPARGPEMGSPGRRPRRPAAAAVARTDAGHMPTINKPFLLKLVLVTVALAGLLVGAHALQARRIPDDPALWQQLGAAQTGLNQLPEARKSYETAITLAPTDKRSYQYLAQLLWRNMDDPAAAKVVLDRMVAAMPQEPEAYLVRARFEKFCADDEPGRGRGVGDINRAIPDQN